MSVNETWKTLGNVTLGDLGSTSRVNNLVIARLLTHSIMYQVSQVPIKQFRIDDIEIAISF